MDAATRRFVRARAGSRREYCRIHEDDEPYAFHLEHIVPKKHGGDDDRLNLAWSCQSCNLGKVPTSPGGYVGKSSRCSIRAGSAGNAISAGTALVWSESQNVAGQRSACSTSMPATEWRCVKP